MDYLFFNLKRKINILSPCLLGKTKGKSYLNFIYKAPCSFTLALNLNHLLAFKLHFPFPNSYCFPKPNYILCCVVVAIIFRNIFSMILSKTKIQRFITCLD